MNASFSNKVQSEIEKDPLADLSRFFELYVKYWMQLSDGNPQEIKPCKASGKKEETKREETEKPKLFTDPSKELKPKQIREKANVSIEPTSNSSSFTFKPSTTFKLNENKPVDSPKPFSFSFAKPAEEKPVEIKEVKDETTKPLFTFSSPPTFQFSPGSQQSQPSQPFNFSFNQPTATATAPSFGVLSPPQTQSQPTECAQEDEPLEPATIGLIRTGAGEEDEEALAEARVKLFIFDKDNGWVDLGVGIFKVNKRKEGFEGPNRLLCRGEASGLILLNSAIIKDVTKAEHESGKKDLKVTCVNQEGKLASYLVRTKEANTAEHISTSIKQLCSSE